jgi:hypothetical protein
MPPPEELQTGAEEAAERSLGNPEVRRRFAHFLRTAQGEEGEALDWISLTLEGGGPP